MMLFGFPTEYHANQYKHPVDHDLWGEMERGYLLHRRPYKESSVLVNLLVDGKGRIDAIAQLGTGKRSIRGILQPFQPLIFNLSGRFELKYLTQVEPLNLPCPLHGESLYASMYLNELLVRVLIQQSSGENLFLPYHEALMTLSTKFCQSQLRYFEKTLLAELGVMPSLKYDVNGNEIKNDKNYQYRAEQGFILADKQSALSDLYTGGAIIRFSNQSLLDDDFKQIKILMRQLLLPFLGYKPLLSRQLFIKKLSKKI